MDQFISELPRRPRQLLATARAGLQRPLLRPALQRLYNNPAIQKLLAKVAPPNWVTKMLQKIRAYTSKQAQWRYLRNLARRSTSTSWDRVRLTEIIQELHQQGVMSTQQVKDLINDPQIKGLSKYLEIDISSGKLLIYDYNARTKLAMIDRVVDRVTHQMTDGQGKLLEGDNLADIRDKWEQFFLGEKLSIEDLQVLQRELAGPIRSDQIIRYQSYINFAQSYRINNSGLLISGINRIRILPGYERATSTEALRHIHQAVDINSDFDGTIAHFRNFRWGPNFIRRFRQDMQKMDQYHQKTLEQEIAVAKRINERDATQLSDNKVLMLAKGEAFIKRMNYQKLYMGCRNMRRSNRHTQNFWPFTTFLLGSNLIIRKLVYTHYTPDENVPSFSDEYYRQIAEAKQNPRWNEVLRYELLIALLSSSFYAVKLGNPLMGNIERWLLFYSMGTMLSPLDSIAFHYSFGNFDQHSRELLNQLLTRKDLDQFYNRIWEIVEAAGLANDFRLALEQVAIKGGQDYYLSGDMTSEMLQEPEVQQVLKEVPARIAEQRAAITGLENINIELYRGLRGGIDAQTATEELGQILNDPEKRVLLDQIRTGFETTAEGQEIRAALNQLAEQMDSRQSSTIAEKLDQEEKAKEIFLKALNEYIYEYQSGALIQTGIVGLDRFLFYFGYDSLATAKNVILGMYMYRVFCVGQRSAASIAHASVVQLVQGLITANILWSFRNWAIGKNKLPSFEDIFMSEKEGEGGEGEERENPAQGFFLPRLLQVAEEE